MNLAPSVDVNIASDNPVIGIRSFGSDPALVARHAAAAVAGCSGRDSRVRQALPRARQHQRGHHHRIVTVEADLDTLRRRDLVPFAAAIAAGVNGVMPGHLRVPS